MLLILVGWIDGLDNVGCGPQSEGLLLNVDGLPPTELGQSDWREFLRIEGRWDALNLGTSDTLERLGLKES